MILGWPLRTDVLGYTTFELIRAKTLLPEPKYPCQVEVMKLIDKRLVEVDTGHRELIERTIGYGPR